MHIFFKSFHTRPQNTGRRITALLTAFALTAALAGCASTEDTAAAANTS